MGIESQHTTLASNVMMQLLVMCDEISISQNAQQYHNNGDSSMSFGTDSLHAPVDDIDDIKKKLKSHTLDDNDDCMSSDSAGTFQSVSERSTSLNPTNKTEQEGFLKKENVTNESEAVSSRENDTLTHDSSYEHHAHFGSHGGLDCQLPDHSADNESTEQNNSVPSSHLVTPNIYLSSCPADDLPVEVGASAQFSKVLENLSLPLLYIPTTKQLVTASSEQQNLIDEEVPISTCSLEQEGPGSSSDLKNLNGGSEYKSSSSPKSASTSSTCAFLNPSPPSLHKVSSAQEFSSLCTKFPDTDRLTLHSSDSSPGLAQHLDNISLSSVSTNFSVSNLSVGDEGDETLFMDINLHTRNSFDINRHSTLLNGALHDQNIPSSQPAKKKPLSGFK